MPSKTPSPLPPVEYIRDYDLGDGGNDLFKLNYHMPRGKAAKEWDEGGKLTNYNHLSGETRSGSSQSGSR